MIRITSFTNKSIAVFGLGKTGISSSRALLDAKANVLAWDDSVEARSNAKSEGLKLTDLYQVEWNNIDTILLSPGIPDQFPKPHPLVERAKRSGCEIICDIELLARETLKPRIIGITGTNGKSTTTALIGHIFSQSNKKYQIGGNFGIPALDLETLDQSGTYILELSSYQLERVPSLLLDLAILMNISPDHLDRHNGMEGYIEAKRNILNSLKPNSKAIIGMDDRFCRAICLEHMVKMGGDNIIPVSIKNRVPGGVYVDDGRLFDDIENNAKVVLDLRDVTILRGTHNWQNIAFAYAASKMWGISEQDTLAAIKSFSGLEHRQNFVRKLGSIEFINDSKATNIEAAARALEANSKILWIAGGRLKENNIDALLPFLGEVLHVYLIGEAAVALSNLLDEIVPTTICNNMDDAVNLAYIAALEKKSATVLLSPACSSFDQYKNFEERGDAFCSIVKKLEDR